MFWSCKFGLLLHFYKNDGEIAKLQGGATETDCFVAEKILLICSESFAMKKDEIECKMPESMMASTLYLPHGLA